MTDEEVGELWVDSKPNAMLSLYSMGRNRHIRDLIRKLVEERAAPADSEYERKRNIDKACHEFGIKPDEFEGG